MEKPAMPNPLGAGDHDLKSGGAMALNMPSSPSPDMD